MEGLFPFDAAGNEQRLGSLNSELENPRSSNLHQQVQVVNLHIFRFSQHHKKEEEKRQTSKNWHPSFPPPLLKYSWGYCPGLKRMSTRLTIYSLQERRLSCSSIGETILAKNKRGIITFPVYTEINQWAETCGTSYRCNYFYAFPTHFLKTRAYFSPTLPPTPQWNDRHVNLLGSTFQRALIFCWQQLAAFQMEPFKLWIRVCSLPYMPCSTKVGNQSTCRCIQALALVSWAQADWRNKMGLSLHELPFRHCQSIPWNNDRDGKTSVKTTK